MNKPIRNYEGLYEIDELGNVYSLRRNKIMSPVMINSGYKTVKLSKDNHLTIFFRWNSCKRVEIYYRSSKGFRI